MWKRIGGPKAVKNQNQPDRFLTNLREICAALPEFKEVEAWGHPTFRAGKKMFAAYGIEHGDPTLGVKVGFNRQDELLEDSRFFPTPYAARQGWVSLHLDRKTNWAEIAGLLHEAYRQVALKRMLTALERLNSSGESIANPTGLSSLGAEHSDAWPG
jgi:predicted DNA-binding protein (MmcQ/YjbR family)